ncbi:hypothetical protein Tco_1002533 [Tanacetum coccineum]|uniref:Uncharacterized protein n=1 Tax=Tanacetum coccineum TaxID=301880 RepID=A0ABQ5F6U9_9ASTR
MALQLMPLELSSQNPPVKPFDHRNKVESTDVIDTQMLTSLLAIKVAEALAAIACDSVLQALKEENNVGFNSFPEQVHMQHKEFHAVMHENYMVLEGAVGLLTRWYETRIQFGIATLQKVTESNLLLAHC